MDIQKKSTCVFDFFFKVSQLKIVNKCGKMSKEEKILNFEDITTNHFIK